MSDRLETRQWRQGPPDRHASYAKQEGADARERFREKRRMRDYLDSLCKCREPTWGPSYEGLQRCKRCGKVNA